MVAVVQLVRASDCGSECRGFESHLPPAKKRKFERIFLFFVIVQTIPLKGRQRGINVSIYNRLLLNILQIISQKYGRYL